MCISGFSLANFSALAAVVYRARAKRVTPCARAKRVQYLQRIFLIPKYVRARFSVFKVTMKRH